MAVWWGKMRRPAAGAVAAVRISARRIAFPLFPATFALLLLACGTADAPPAAEADASPVRLIRVGEAADAPVRVATGTVRLRRETPLAFVDSGRITMIAVRPGDRVAAGQVLARLDSSAIDAAVAAAAADRQRAHAELARQQTLLKQGWVAKSRVEAAEAAARSTDAQLETRRFSQRFATIRAPSSGMILDRMAEPGQTIAAGTPLLLLGEDGAGHVVQVGLSAADAAALAIGAVADVAFRDGAAPAMRARLVELAGRADPRTGTFRAEFALPADAALRSGQIAELRWQAARAAGPQPLRVPASALFAARAGEAFVWVYDEEGRAVRARMVRIGLPADAGVPVLSGLAAGERIVGAGVDRLVDGQTVRAVAE